MKTRYLVERIKSGIVSLHRVSQKYQVSSLTANFTVHLDATFRLSSSRRYFRTRRNCVIMRDAPLSRRIFALNANIRSMSRGAVDARVLTRNNYYIVNASAYQRCCSSTSASRNFLSDGVVFHSYCRRATRIHMGTILFVVSQPVRSLGLGFCVT